MTTTHTNVDLQVCVDGNKQAEYGHDGRFYIEAKDGQEYAVRLRNNNPFRVLVAISIDGVNAVSGKPATGTKEDTGYILGPHESQLIRGYRLSDTEVANFRFTKAATGYAQAEKGMIGTTGVIGVKVWREKEQPTPVIVKEVHHHHDYWNHWIPRYHTYPTWRWANDELWYSSCNQAGSLTTATATAGMAAFSYTCSNSVGGSAGSVSNSVAQSAMNCSSVAEPTAARTLRATSLAEANPFDAGSTFGSRAESHVTTVAFIAEICLGEVTLFYAFKAGLQALGVDMSRAQKVAFPEAFSGQYCSPPKGYAG